MASKHETIFLIFLLQNTRELSSNENGVNSCTEWEQRDLHFFYQARAVAQDTSGSLASS